MVVERQLACLLHRGPDAVGIHADGDACIGQTRLAIIDLVTGDPPITTPDRRIAVAFNGEIYDFAEQRRRLVEAGHRFASVGDTEVIAHLAEASDPVALASSLHGMFAAAVWDSRDGRLVLVRDRLGKKPLYWTQTGGAFVFGSEIKAVLAHPDVVADLEEDAIPAFLHLGYVPTPRTFFRGIHSLPPGHVLILDRGGEPRVERYWEPPVATSPQSKKRRLGMADATRAVRRGLEAAVGRRLIADVPLGAFLSGGVDSSAVVALMSTLSADPVKTFTIGFEDQHGFDERSWAALVAARYGTDHTELVVHPFGLELIDELVWHHDQPFGDSSAVPMWFLAKLTREHVTVALSGDGGDELFAGYERFAAGVASARLSPVASLLAPAVRRAAPLARHRRARVERFARELSQGLPDGYREWVAYTSSSLVRELCPRGSTWAIDDYAKTWARSEGAHPLDRLLDLNQRTYLLDDLLPKVDRMSMAHGLEVRSPFLDHELVEMAASFAPSTKLRGFALKRVLRAAVADLVPNEILDRPKRGFGVPLDRWFRDDLAEFVSKRIGSPSARVRQHLDPTVVDEILARHRAGSSELGDTIWSLLTLESFLGSRGW